MNHLFSIGPKGTVFIYDVELVGFNAVNLHKTAIFCVFLLLLFGIGWMLRRAVHRLMPDRGTLRTAFWTQQGINLLLALLLVVGVASIWFDNPARLTTALGFLTAGLAFSLQKLVTSVSGYFIILRGRTFNVGDRIVMGGVRGDVIGLRFTQTTIMEMGQPPSVQSADPAMWVRSRQYTGRIVTVPNSKIFDEPIYNYSRDFEYIWEEMMLPINYKDDRVLAEQILLDAAAGFQVNHADLKQDKIIELLKHYSLMDVRGLEAKVYYRLTDNWLELTVRFLTRPHGVRDVKDAMSRQILAALDAAKIGIASSTYDIVGLPTLRVELADDRRPSLRAEKQPLQSPPEVAN